MLTTAIDCRNALGTDVTYDDVNPRVTAAVRTLLNGIWVEGVRVNGKLCDPPVSFTPFPRRVPTRRVSRRLAHFTLMFHGADGCAGWSVECVGRLCNVTLITSRASLTLSLTPIALSTTCC